MSKKSAENSKSYIQIHGARVNNLKNIDVDIPKNKLVVITGMSGSGKSSLAFDTLYAEGQRRYVESLSSFSLRSFSGISGAKSVSVVPSGSSVSSLTMEVTVSLVTSRPETGEIVFPIRAKSSFK